jgi:hypothetical protein
MTTRDYADAYADDSENVRGWPAQDAQMPPNDSDVAYLRAEVAALKVERAHTMSWYKTVCELLTEHTAERDGAQVEIVRLQNELHGVLCDRAEAWATIARMVEP